MKNEHISQFLQDRIDANDFPSAVYLVAEKGEIILQDALGIAVVEPERIDAKLDTIYDLASLTKVLVTGLLTARLIEEGELNLDSPIGQFSADFGNSNKRDINIRQLVTHTSGFAAWIPLYLMASSRADVPRIIAERPLVTSSEDTVIYSDLNFIALSHVIQGLRVDIGAGHEIFDKLGLTRTAFNPLSENARSNLDQRQIAGSEKGNEYERNTCRELFPELNISQSALRNSQIWGEVHDGNAWFMGGVAGHAGLFSTAGEVFRIAQQFLPNYTTLLKPETCELFRTNFTPGMNEHRSFAFQLASTPESTAGTKMSPESFGHLGFTGTSLWIDPVKERVFILLTNRTHNHALPFVNINSVRRRFHDLAVDFLEKNR